jgi:hypothetical protein
MHIFFHYGNKIIQVFVLRFIPEIFKDAGTLAQVTLEHHLDIFDKHLLMRDIGIDVAGRLPSRPVVERKVIFYKKVCVNKLLILIFRNKVSRRPACHMHRHPCEHRYGQALIGAAQGMDNPDPVVFIQKGHVAHAPLIEKLLVLEKPFWIFRCVTPHLNARGQVLGVLEEKLNALPPAVGTGQRVCGQSGGTPQVLNFVKVIALIFGGIIIGGQPILQKKGDFVFGAFEYVNIVLRQQEPDFCKLIITVERHHMLDDLVCINGVGLKMSLSAPPFADKRTVNMQEA